MADRGHGEDGGYWLRYLAASAGILVVTWAVVTRVLPPRLMPNADFRERALRFSTDPPTFELPEQLAFSRVSMPVPGPSPEPDDSAGPRLGERGRLWRDLEPLVDTARWREAATRLRAYLADHPGDGPVRLELARVLARSGRAEQAESEYRRLVEAGDIEGIVGLAHLLWRRHRLRRAAEQFRRALERRPGDEGIRSSLARVLRTLRQYPGAARHYRRLMRTSDRPGEYRIELARTLAWAGQPREALAELRRAEGREASELAGRIAATLRLPSPDSVVADPVARARRARGDGELRRASHLYRLATGLRPADTAIWLEWADLLALEMQEPGRAVAVLEQYAATRGAPPPAVRSRMARYAAWSGQEERARRLLGALAREGAASPGDLALLGDLLRWADRRRRSDDVYRRALAAPGADSAAVRRAERGLQELRARDRQVADARDPRRVELTGSRFDDSDGFGRTDLRATAVFGTGSGPGRFLAATGWSRLEGARVAGSDDAAVLEVGWLRWLDHATARLELRAGRERRGSGLGGTSRFSGDLVLLDRGVDRLGLEVSRGPAHEVTQSLASLRRGQLATGAGLRLHDAPGDATSVDLRVRTDLLHGEGTDRNLRTLGTGSWTRSVGGGLRLGAAGRLVAYTSPAFPAGTRPGYWSPEYSVTPSAVADWRLRPDGTGWGLHARLQPGLSVVKEHGAADPTAGSSVYAAGGARYRWSAATAGGTVSWVRSRAGEYDALSATLGLTWRF